MLRRILFTTAAATLLAAAPALAAEHAAPRTQPCSCCSDGSMHQTDHTLRESHTAAPAVRTGRQPVSADPSLKNQNSDDPYLRNNSFGG